MTDGRSGAARRGTQTNGYGCIENRLGGRMVATAKNFSNEPTFDSFSILCVCGPTFIGVSCASSAIFLLHSGDVSFGSAIVVREFVCVGWMWWWYFYYILPIWNIVYMNSTNSQHVNYAKFFSTKNKIFLFANVPCPCIFHMLNCVRFLYTSEQ